MDGQTETIKISYPGKSLEFDGSVVTLASPKRTVAIPVQRISSVSVPGYT